MINFSFEVIETPPLKLQAIIGDVVHNLRSSLDILVQDLRQISGAPGRISDAAFPICTTLENFQKVKSKRLRGLSDNLKREVLDLQPFRSGDQRLLHLTKRNNTDKHHELVSTSVDPTTGWIEGRQKNAPGAGIVNVKPPANIDLTELGKREPYASVAEQLGVTFADTIPFSLFLSFDPDDIWYVADEDALQTLQGFVDAVVSTVAHFESIT
ncbi:MAG: hypothetical protein ACU0A6_17035 [Shimia sp.]|uniref:hypothetical protein n=1 Tax=Shimia sp. TaxID=1954381 RepID=UPI00405819CF